MKKKRFIKCTIILVSVILISLTAASFYFYNLAVKRSTGEFLNDNPDLAVSTDDSLASEGLAWLETVSFDEVKITSNDALKLVGYYLPAETKGNKTVIIAHGYTSEAMNMHSYAKFYHELGYNVLMPDARGHGASEGDYIGFGWPERLDYMQWINYVLKQNGDDTEIVLHGVSMGSATVMMTSGEDLPEQVKAVVADCGYTSAEDVLSYQLERMYHLPSFPILQATSLMTQIRAGYSFSEASALEQVKKTDKPILFIHGEDDTFVPVEMVYELYEAANGDKELLIVQDAEHANAYDANPVLYEETVTNFLNQYVE
ncbi:MAG: alpha/beta hydrolase [Bacillus sp. (in: firmicutes)]